MGSSLLAQFEAIRNLTLDLARPLEIEDYVPQVAEFASPPKWHLAHTTWFFEVMILKKYSPNYDDFDPDFKFFFNSYYNSLGKRTKRNERGTITRPGVKRVLEYRSFVDEKMRVLLADPPTEASFRDLVVLGLNHEQQHQELFLTDLKLAFSLNPIFPVYKESSNLVADHNSVLKALKKVEEGVYMIGYEGSDFHFDNEQARHKVYLQPFEISTVLVTNGEYLAFIEAGGYTQPHLWLDEGWTWLQSNDIKCPLYWDRSSGGEWFYYTLAGLKPLDPDALVCHVSFYEANAYATWCGMRLPTEFEWEVAVISPSPLVVGKRWEWTNSAYLPYPGFVASPGAVGEYNGKFMINQMVLRGGSVATPVGHIRTTYRNFFHPHFQWQFSGIRLARDWTDPSSDSNN